MSIHAPALRHDWAKSYIEKRDATIEALNRGEQVLPSYGSKPTYRPINETTNFFADRYLQDEQFPGISQELFKKYGIESDLCKVGILNFVPHEFYQMAFDDLDAFLPPDFIENSVTYAHIGDDVDASQSKFQDERLPVHYKTKGTSSFYAT